MSHVTSSHEVTLAGLVVEHGAVVTRSVVDCAHMVCAVSHCADSNICHSVVSSGGEFQSYKGGVFSGCNSTVTNTTDHAVTVTGRMMWRKIRRIIRRMMWRKIRRIIWKIMWRKIRRIIHSIMTGKIRRIIRRMMWRRIRRII
jgi:hypothetical protein